MKKTGSIFACGVMLALWASAPVAAATLIYGDADYDLDVDIDDAASALGTRLTGSCALANLAVTNDATFDLSDVMYIAQYANAQRPSGDLVGDGVDPFSIDLNTGDSQSGDGGTTLPLPLTVLATHRTVSGLCIDPILAFMEMAILSDAGSPAGLSDGGPNATALPSVGFDPFGLSLPVTLTLGSNSGGVSAMSRIDFASPDGTPTGMAMRVFWAYSVSATCGNGFVDYSEKCDPGIDPCCSATCDNPYACMINRFALGLGAGAPHVVTNPLPMSLAGTTLSVSGQGLVGTDGPPCDETLGCDRGLFNGSSLRAFLLVENVGAGDADCLYLTYRDSWPVADPNDLDRSGQVVCSGGPYGPSSGGFTGMDFDADGDSVMDGWGIGPMSSGATAGVTVSIESSNVSHCIHFFDMAELPGGNHPGCVTTCGDGILAYRNGEACEPVDNGMGTATDLGCEDISDPWNACVSSANCLCDAGDPCGGCVQAPDLCGNGTLDAGEVCDPGLPQGDYCCDPASCQWAVSGSADPQEACAGAGSCESDVCDGLGGCMIVSASDGTACGNPVTTDCDSSDTCLAGVCQSNFSPAGTPCGGSLAEPICDPDGCDGAGACIDIPSTPDCTPCAENGGVLCYGGLCSTYCSGAVISATPTARKGTSPGYADDWNNGQTSGFGGPTDLFTILPNDPAATHGVDMIVFDIVLSSSLGTTDLVFCDISGIPASTNCGVGDSACLGWGEHPQITGGGLDTMNQQALNSTQLGIGTAIAPDEADTATFASIACSVNGGAATTQNVLVHMGFVGVPDQAVAAGTTDVIVTPHVYCSNGATEWCGAILNGAPFFPDRGVSVVWTNIYYDPAVFDLGLIGEIGQTHGRALGPYFIPAQGDPALPSGFCNTYDRSPECVQIAPGILRYQSDTSYCQGAIMVVAGSCILGASASPPTGTITPIDASAADINLNAYIYENTHTPIRGIDANSAVPLPSTNVTGYVIWD